MVDVVCAAYAFEVTPISDPTQEMPRSVDTYRLRVTHVWKGSPPDTLVFHGGTVRYLDSAGSRCVSIMDPAPPSFVAGKRYLIFTSYRPTPYDPTSHRAAMGGWMAQSHTQELLAAKADLFFLQRDFGPGRSVVPNDAPIPCVSYRSLIQDLDHGDSLAQISAVSAFREIEDSAGIVLPALVRALHRERPTNLRRRSCRLIADFAKTMEPARDAYFLALQDPDPAVRRVAAATPRFRADEELRWGVLDRRKDPVPEVRAEAIFTCAKLLAGQSPPVREYREALEDSAAIVRIEAIYALEKLIDDPQIKAALEERMTDRDSTVAAVAKKVVGRMGTKRR
jgi:hypothetical protein